ncbi:MAG: hypothetical protein KU37_04845 [Sulfuricurvum sp. PC08-66]|nr:MAG: hypothetical protein KU37_04845 [Sulfuricurvum sp. PC08-66]
MKTITLHVDDAHYATLMTILENLKEGLVVRIDGEAKPPRKSAYTPKTGKIIHENERPSGKYASPTEYKKRLQK